jgi:uncharacterized integral membrane protein
LKNFKRFFLLAMIILIGIFAFRNQTYLGQRVDLVFFRDPFSMVLGFWLVASFLVGAFLYMVIDMPKDLAMKRDLRRKSHEINRLQAEITKLQQSSSGSAAPLVNPDWEKPLDL